MDKYEEVIRKIGKSRRNIMNKKQIEEGVCILKEYFPDEPDLVEQVLSDEEENEDI